MTLAQLHLDGMLVPAFRPAGAGAGRSALMDRLSLLVDRLRAFLSTAALSGARAAPLSRDAS